jgi:hypothetical protein
MLAVIGASIQRREIVRLWAPLLYGFSSPRQMSGSSLRTIWISVSCSPRWDQQAQCDASPHPGRSALRDWRYRGPGNPSHQPKPGSWCSRYRGLPSSSHSGLANRNPPGDAWLSRNQQFGATKRQPVVYATRHIRSRCDALEEMLLERATSAALGETALAALSRDRIVPRLAVVSRLLVPYSRDRRLPGGILANVPSVPVSVPQPYETFC